MVFGRGCGGVPHRKGTDRKKFGPIHLSPNPQRMTRLLQVIFKTTGYYRGIPESYIRQRFGYSAVVR